jgi:hypothetical protein
MNKEEVATAAYNDARIALDKTQEKLEKAEEVVAEWKRLKSDEDWDEATLTFKNKTLDEWKLEVIELKEKEKDAKQREEKARASFDRVVQGSIITNFIRSRKSSVCSL